MANRQRRSLFLLIVILLVLIACVGLVTGYLYINSEVKARYGEPSPLLSLTQRVIYPLELFSNRAEMFEPLNPVGEELAFSVGAGRIRFHGLYPFGAGGIDPGCGNFPNLSGL